MNPLQQTVMAELGQQTLPSGPVGHPEEKASAFRGKLLRWATTHPRPFAWRQRGISSFTVLLAEALLTRTRAQSVERVLLRRLERSEDPRGLARLEILELERILHPLGLHRKRARALKKCAQMIVERHQGHVPDDHAELMELPSVGRYGASAIRCFGFGKRCAIVDANVARIIRRVFGLSVVAGKLSAADELWEFALKILPRTNVRAFNWALLDFGREICKGSSPACAECPVAKICEAHESGRCRCRQHLVQDS